MEWELMGEKCALTISHISLTLPFWLKPLWFKGSKAEIRSITHNLLSATQSINRCQTSLHYTWGESVSLSKQSSIPLTSDRWTGLRLENLLRMKLFATLYLCWMTENGRLLETQKINLKFALCFSYYHVLQWKKSQTPHTNTDYTLCCVVHNSRCKKE